MKRFQPGAGVGIGLAWFLAAAVPAADSPPAASGPPPIRGDPPASVVTDRTSRSKPKPTVAFSRQWERHERAFSLLVPDGWQMEGGMFNVNPLQAGGPGNALMPKCDLTVRRDAEGTVCFRSLPTWNYADFSQAPGMAPAAGFFPPGSSYNGMKVRSMPSARGFLEELMSTLHPRATDLRVIVVDPMPEIVAAYERGEATLNQQLQGLGLGGFRYQAAALLVEYREGDCSFREALFTALRDARPLGFWCNEWTMAARAPLAEADAWKPVLDTIRTSVRFNPDWIQRVMRNADERGRIIQETQEYIAKVDREIYRNRQQTQARIDQERYLLITGQEEFVNPYTREVETDTNQYQRRWTTADGRYLYTDDANLDPNRTEGLNQVEWKETRIRPR